MKKYSLFALIFVLLAIALPALAQPLMMMRPDDTEPGQQRLIWSTDPGIRYELQETDNLADPDSWTTVAGYPTESEALAQQALIALDAPVRKFYRVQMLDEQPPIIVERYPAPDAFAIPRFADVRAVLSDSSGVDPSSLTFTLGTNSPVTVASPSLSYSSNVLTFVTTDHALGGWGETVTVSVAAADIKGNGHVTTWSFRLEVEAVTTSNLFVFGSPAAERAGQRVSGPAAALASRFKDAGPVRASGNTADWSIQEVTSNTLVLAYTSVEIPSFAAGQLICNLAPTTVDEIFYRRVLGAETNEIERLLMLSTEDLALTDFIVEGSASFSENSVMFETDANGTLQAARYIGGNMDFPPLIVNLSGGSAGLRDDGFKVQAGPLSGSVGSAPVWLTIDFNELAFSLDTDFQSGFDIGLSGFKAFHTSTKASAELDLDIQATVNFAGARLDQSLGTIKGPLWAIYVGQVGPVPIYGTLQILTELKLEAEAAVGLSFDLLYRHDHDLFLGMDWRKGQGMVWEHSYTERFRETGGGVELNGQLSFALSLQPRLEFMLYAIAGYAAELEAKGEVEIPTDGSKALLTTSLTLTGAPVIRWVDFSREDESISLTLWSSSWPLFPPAPQTPLAFRTQPQNRTVNEGESVAFSCAVEGASSPSYRWFHKGLEVPGQSGPALTMVGVTPAHGGTVQVQVRSGTESIQSEPAMLTVLYESIPLATGFQYPIGDRGYIPEFPLNPEISETNDQYGANTNGDLEERVEPNVLGSANTWVNKQDVGAFHSGFGALHPGEDWNFGSSDDDVGKPVYPVAIGKVVQVAPTKSGSIQEQGWRVIIEHLLDRSIRKPGEASRYYSIYAHITSDPDGTIPFTQTGFPYQVGDVVELDQPLGYIARLVTPDFSPHLHLELREYKRSLSGDESPWKYPSRGGYYSDGNATKLTSMTPVQVQVAFDLMRAEGILDPSDFIDAHQMNAPTPTVGDYLVIDLSGGSSASSYPVSYLTAVPPGGWTDEYKTTKLVMRRIPAGSFTMGSPTNELGRYSDEPQHQVTLTKDFYIGVFEVTQKQWERVMGNWPSYFTNTVYRDSRPLEQRSWNDIRGGTWPSGQAASGTFMQWISSRTGLTFDLPTEAQWEYACRAGTTTALNSGYNLTSTSSDIRMDEVGRYWYNGGSGYSRGGSTGGGTAKVGSYLPNAWGLYDMHGNVWEWCLDWNTAWPPGTIDPVGAASGSNRVMRGGSWGSSARYCRSASRSDYAPSGRSSDYGFRLSRTLP